MDMQQSTRQDSGQAEAPRAVASTARYALPENLTLLDPLRNLLGALPAVFPTSDNRRIRPLAIGADKPLIEMAVARGVETDQAEAVVRQVLRRYCRSGRYRSALNPPDAMRHALDGTPMEPVADEHKVLPRRPKPKAARPTAQRLKPFVMSVAVKVIKVTAVLDPRALRPAPAGADVVLEVTTEGGIKARARLQPAIARPTLGSLTSSARTFEHFPLQHQHTRGASHDYQSHHCISAGAGGLHIRDGRRADDVSPTHDWDDIGNR